MPAQEPQLPEQVQERKPPAQEPLAQPAKEALEWKAVARWAAELQEPAQLAFAVPVFEALVQQEPVQPVPAPAEPEPLEPAAQPGPGARQQPVLAESWERHLRIVSSSRSSWAAVGVEAAEEEGAVVAAAVEVEEAAV